MVLGRQSGFPSPRCHRHISHRNCWITPSTIYTTQDSPSKVVASSPNPGPAYPKASLRQSHLQHPTTPAIMEDNISGFLHLSRAYTKDLVVWCPELVIAADAEERGWIRAFSQVAHLGLDFDWQRTSLLPFHGLSLALKSLHLDYSCVLIPRVLNLIHSFPSRTSMDDTLSFNLFSQDLRHLM